MTQQTSVRRFNPAEWSLYKTLRLRSLEDSPSAFGSTLDLELERTDAAWTERLQNAVSSGQDCALIAEVKEAPSGLVWAKADANDPGIVNIFQMWVAPEARGRGVGDALLQAAIHWARQYGARFAKLGVTCGDTPAVRLYQRAGFVEFGAREPIRAGSVVLAQNMVLALPKSAA
jgi:ribosomal protein S18 acetylase RimI-like enzyme